MAILNEYELYSRRCDTSFHLVERRILRDVFGNRLRNTYQNQLVSGNDPIYTVLGPKIPKHFRVLDLGTGIGKVPEALIQFGVLPEMITAVDINPDRLNSRLFPAGVHKVCADVRKPIFDSNIKFDFIVANMLFHLFSFEDYRTSLMLIKNLLRKDSKTTRAGSFLIILPHPYLREALTTDEYEHTSPREEITPWEDSISIVHKTYLQYIRGTFDARLSITHMFTCWRDAKNYQNAHLNSNRQAWYGIRDHHKKEGYKNIYLRLWMFGN